jgi:carboxymethylenebutenolidase
MCDDDIHPGFIEDPTVSRRTFGLIGVAAAGIATGAVAQARVVEKDVDVKTPDGVCDAALFYPEGRGRWPAVIVWPDIVGLRPVFREMGRRLASSGYVVLVVNPFYRSKRAPVVSGTFNFSNPADRAVVTGYRALITDTGADQDNVAFVAFLDAQPQTDKRAKVGVQGYCMGGPLSFRAAAAAPARIGAVASFHGGGLATQAPNSPHLLIPRTNASYLVAVADNDDQRDPAAKDTLKAAFAAAGKPAVVEVYKGANHGWTVRGSDAYNEPAAEKAWSELLALYKRALA